MHSMCSSRPGPTESPSSWRGVSAAARIDTVRPVIRLIVSSVRVRLASTRKTMREPGQEPARVEDHHVELAVVDGGVGQQRHPGLQVADVADDDRAGPVGGRLAAVDRDLHLRHREHQRLQRRPDVGEPADLLLDVLVDALHDRGVEAHAGHHHEVGVLEVVAAHRDHVDGAVLAGQGDVDRGPHVERDVEVAGQQVAGAGGHDADRVRRCRRARRRPRAPCRRRRRR